MGLKNHPTRVSDPPWFGHTSEQPSILLVDPWPTLRDKLGRELSDRGLRVWIASSVESALEIIQLHPPAVVVLEVRFEDGSWREVVSAVDLARTRVLLLTSFPSMATAVGALRMGVHDCLVKPVASEVLLRAAFSLERLSPEGISSLSLDRTIHEILWQAVEQSGSIAGAARMLRLDRRSLRRMLQKEPPES